MIAQSPARETLAQNSAEHWGWNTSPFSPQSPRSGYVETRVHEEAIARLTYLVEQSRPVGWLNGEGGCGKTVLLRELSRRLRRKRSTNAVVDLVCDATLFDQLCDQFRIWPETNEIGLRGIWSDIQNELDARRRSGTRTTFLLDDVAGSEIAVELLGWLTNYCDRSGGSEIAIVCTARSHTAISRDACGLRCAGLNVSLGPLNARQSADWIRGVLQAAGCDRELFATEAITEIHSTGSGNLRKMSQLCEAALHTGMLAGRETVSADDVTRGVLEHVASCDNLTAMAVG